MLCSVVRRLGVQKTFTRLDELLSQSPSLCKIKVPISLPNIFWLNSNYLPWIQRGCCPEAILLETRQAGGGRGWGGGGGPHLGYEERDEKKTRRMRRGWMKRRSRLKTPGTHAAPPELRRDLQGSTWGRGWRRCTNWLNLQAVRPPVPAKDGVDGKGAEGQLRSFLPLHPKNVLRISMWCTIEGIFTIA